MASIKLIKPCLTNSERLMGEARLTARDREVSFDAELLKRELGEAGLQFKYSDALGIANIQFGDKIVILSRSGRVIVRLAKGKEDIIDTLNRISEIVWPAAVCDGAKCTSKAPKFE